MLIQKIDITAGLERESSLMSVNLNDNSGVSMYDRVFIDHDEILAGAVNEAVNNLTQNMQVFTTAYSETPTAYSWTLTKTPNGLADDVLNYIVDYTMHEWHVKALREGADSFGARAAASLQNIARKLYFKSCPV